MEKRVEIQVSFRFEGEDYHTIISKTVPVCELASVSSEAVRKAEEIITRQSHA